MQEPHELHWKKKKRILRYINGTTSFGIHYVEGYSLDIVGYKDLDWIGDKTNHKSTSGYVLYLGSRLICWSSKKPSTISLSLVEAEYMGVVNVTTQAIWLHHFLTELGIHFHHLIFIWCDNHITLKLCRDLVRR